jgi:hypothetical protein
MPLTLILQTDFLSASMNEETEEEPTLDYEYQEGDQNQDDDFSDTDESPASSQGATGSEWESSQTMPVKNDPYPKAAEKREILTFWRDVKKVAKRTTTNKERGLTGHGIKW